MPTPEEATRQCIEALRHGAESTQPDAHFIEASRDWTESPVYHKPFPFPTP